MPEPPGPSPDRQKETEKAQTLRTLYPIFKKEVFDRRDRIMRIAALASGFLLLFLTWTLFLVSSGKLPPGSSWFLAAGVLIFTGMSIHHMKQHSRRHAQAKQAVIDIEKALGLFEAGTYFPDRGLYPEHWKERPVRDPSLFWYSALMVLMALLIILPLLIMA